MIQLYLRGGYTNIAITKKASKVTETVSSRPAVPSFSPYEVGDCAAPFEKSLEILDTIWL